ncbi:MAG: lysophospholipid acyltransferase family protein [Candidatus Binatia bacterium]
MRHPLRRIARISPRLRRLWRRLKNAGVSALARLALWSVGRLSLEHAVRTGEVVGGVLYRFLPALRRLALEHLRIAFGDELTPTAREHLARASFVNVARSFCELAKIDEIRQRRDEYFELEGWEHAEQLLAGGKGVVVVTGHIGNWELLAAYFAWKGLPVAAVARRIYAKRLNQLLVDFRRRQGVETILRESPQSARQILKALKANTLLAMVIDQDTEAPSVSVPFFGRLARTPAAAASLALRSDLPITTVFIKRRPEPGHRITICPPVEVARSGDRQADIRALTRQLNAALETHIRKNPAEWVWWHRRWRRAPLPHLDLDRDFQYTSQDSVLRGGG